MEPLPTRWTRYGKAGLPRMNRTSVHLNLDYWNAVRKNRGHSDPVVLVIDAMRMHNNGFVLYRSMDNVVLTEIVPREYIVGIIGCRGSDRGRAR